MIPPTECCTTRTFLKISRREFALLLNLSKKTIENWEISKDRSTPEHTKIIFSFILSHRDDMLQRLFIFRFSKKIKDENEKKALFILLEKLLKPSKASMKMFLDVFFEANPEIFLP